MTVALPEGGHSGSNEEAGKLGMYFRGSMNSTDNDLDVEV